jgi:anti-sigma B factor antagonist
MGLLVSIDAGAERTTLSFQGELDLSDGPSLEALIDAVAWTDAAGVVIDLTDLSFLDSAGLGYLVKARQRLCQEGKEVEVRCAHGRIMRTISRSSLNDVLNVSELTNGGRLTDL